jgi:hypothetical protein
MAAIMAAMVLWAPLGRAERSALVALTLSAVIGPWVTSYPLAGGVAMTVLMVAAFTVLVRTLSRPVPVRPREVGLLIGLAVAFLAMAVAGLALVGTGGSSLSVLGFGTVMGVAMGV